MFGFLKDKLKKWTESFSKKEEVVEETKEKTKSKAEKKSKVKKDKKTKQENKKEQIIRREELTEEEIKEERKLGESLHQDIEKEEEKQADKKTLEIIQPEIQKEEKKGFFSKIRESFTTKEITQEELDENFSELEMALLENNVALEVVDELKHKLSEKLVGKRLQSKNIAELISESLKESIESIIIEPFDLIRKIKEKDGVYTIVFFGINGSGKTTTIAKFANLLKKNKISCVLAAADTFRAASIEQIQLHADKLGVKLIKHDYKADPAAVGFDAIKYAKSNNIKVVLIDTAGRMYTESNLMKEMEKIVRVTNPDMKIFIGESTTGNDATTQAREFSSSAGLDAIILSKADVDEKGGTILSVGFVTGKPILYLGVGQEYDDLEPFDKKKALERLGL